MAHITELLRYNTLCNLIFDAVDEANDNTPEDERSEFIWLAISYDLSEVYATYQAWWNDERFVDADLKGWFQELVPADDPASIAEYYFDLR